MIPGIVTFFPAPGARSVVRLTAPALDLAECGLAVVSALMVLWLISKSKCEQMKTLLWVFPCSFAAFHMYLSLYVYPFPNMCGCYLYLGYHGATWALLMARDSALCDGYLLPWYRVKNDDYRIELSNNII